MAARTNAKVGICSSGWQGKMETTQNVGRVLPAWEHIRFRTEHLRRKTTGTWPDRPGSQAAHRNVPVGTQLGLRMSSQRCWGTITTFSPAGQVSQLEERNGSRTVGGVSGALGKAGEAPRLGPGTLLCVKLENVGD